MKCRGVENRHAVGPVVPDAIAAQDAGGNSVWILAKVLGGMFAALAIVPAICSGFFLLFLLALKAICSAILILIMSVSAIWRSVGAIARWLRKAVRVLSG